MPTVSGPFKQGGDSRDIGVEKVTLYVKAAVSVAVYRSWAVQTCGVSFFIFL